MFPRFGFFFDHLPPSVYIFYGIKVYKKVDFFDHLPSVVCERSLGWNLYIKYNLYLIFRVKFVTVLSDKTVEYLYIFSFSPNRKPDTKIKF